MLVIVHIPFDCCPKMDHMLRYDLGPQIIWFAAVDVGTSTLTNTFPSKSVFDSLFVRIAMLSQTQKAAGNTAKKSIFCASIPGHYSVWVNCFKRFLAKRQGSFPFFLI